MRLDLRKFVEFVTSPNNPDGKFRKPLTNAQVIIADFVFASTAFGSDGSGYIEKNIEWIRQLREQGKHVFSFNSASKQFGKTDTRCGYIWYPIDDPYAKSIFKNFFSFISSSTVAAGSGGLAEFLDLIKAYLDLPDTGRALRQDVNQTMAKRHELAAKELLQRYSGSEIISIPGSPTLFAKIKDDRIPKQRAADILLEDLQVLVNNGEPMGESNEYVRLNLSGYSQILAEFLNRLSGKNKYKAQDLLIASSHQCSQTFLYGKEDGVVRHYVHPGDCIIEADALKGPIEIRFPPFIDYERSQVITVTKMDASFHPVILKVADFTLTLQNPRERVKVQWTQPLYQNGQWKKLD